MILTYRPAPTPPRGRTWALLRAIHHSRPHHTPHDRRHGDVAGEGQITRTSAAGADGGHGGQATRCRGVGDHRPGGRAPQDQPHNLTTRHFAPRVRAFGRFAVPSPSFPSNACGRPRTRTAIPCRGREAARGFQSPPPDSTQIQPRNATTGRWRQSVAKSSLSKNIC
jgi:hypothetical protein